jgi:cytochrome c oxidase accessory protein FixG
MTETTEKNKITVDEIYGDTSEWHLNTGDERIYAKRMAGRFRSLKWWLHSVWIVFFLGQYLRWGDRQAVLFNIPDRQFHILGITILPQDVWMLSLLLLFFAILLAVVTSIAGRVYCGFFCFQTVWTDVFMWIEEKIEGQPAARRKLDQSPWNMEKFRIKTIKYLSWLVIGFLTGMAFVGWFTDAWALWPQFFTLQASSTIYITVLLFTVGTYVLAGIMREQTCFWLCPYARIQSVMYDTETILPTYDYKRGEPRGRLKKGQPQEDKGDCIECGQCVAVCPTGIDIRAGQQEGCITCGLCIDACDSIMDKINKSRGLIRYASYDEIEGQPAVPLFKRPRVIVYLGIITLAFCGILYGLTHLGSIKMQVLHERQPLFVMQSDGSIQNKFVLKIQNKTSAEMKANVTAKGPKGMVLMGAEHPLLLKKANTSSFTVFVKTPKENINQAREPLTFYVENIDDKTQNADYESMFFSPQH